MNSNWFKLILKLQKIKYGKKLKLEGMPVIVNKGKELVIGDHVTVKSGFLSNLVGLYSRSIIITRTPQAVIQIGNHVGISGATIYARKGIYIGDNTLIGGNAKILDNDFHPLDAIERNKLERGDNKEEIEIPSKEIHIGANCFIGCNTIILKGTSLGDGCVVGAGAVVSGVFPENSVIVGNPARVIRTLSHKEL